jgi:hypothetical protein
MFGVAAGILARANEKARLDSRSALGNRCKEDLKLILANREGLQRVQEHLVLRRLRDDLNDLGKVDEMRFASHVVHCDPSHVGCLWKLIGRRDVFRIRQIVVSARHVTVGPPRLELGTKGL